MERMTRVLDTGNIWPIHGVDEALKKLAAYEDTGLEPSEFEPVKRGHWIEKHRHRGGYREVTGKKPMSYETHTIVIDERYEIDDLYCSECGKLNESVFTNYCPNCGAKMEQEATRMTIDATEEENE